MPALIGGEACRFQGPPCPFWERRGATSRCASPHDRPLHAAGLCLSVLWCMVYPTRSSLGIMGYAVRLSDNSRFSNHNKPEQKKKKHNFPVVTAKGLSSKSNIYAYLLCCFHAPSFSFFFSFVFHTRSVGIHTRLLPLKLVRLWQPSYPIAKRAKRRLFFLTPLA